MKLGDVLDDGKAQPGPAKRTASVLVDAIEPLEYPRLAIGRYASTMIGDNDLRPSVGATRNRDLDGFRPAVTDRVLDEIRNCRLDETWIAGTVQYRQPLHADRDPRTLRQRSHEIDGGLDDVTDIADRELGRARGLRLFKVRQLKNVLGKCVEAHGLILKNLQKFLPVAFVKSETAVRKDINRAENTRYRRLDLVGDVGDEVPSELFELAHFRPSACLRHGR